MIGHLTSLLPRLARPFFPNLVWRTDPSGNTIHLTFDDGPTPELTPRLLEILKHHNVPATFFLIGLHVQQHPELVEAIVEAGYSLGNHSYTHADPWRTPSSRMVREYDRTDNLLERISGRPVQWLRPPYGHYTSATGAWRRDRRKHIAMWDVMPGDFLSSMTSEKLVNRLTRYTRSGSIIVLHDNEMTVGILPEALNVFIEVAKEKGLIFKNL